MSAILPDPVIDITPQPTVVMPIANAIAVSVADVAHAELTTKAPEFAARFKNAPWEQQGDAQLRRVPGWMFTVWATGYSVKKELHG